MAGLILGCYGFQRSGKTFIAALISTILKEKYNIEVYSNITSPDFIHITSLTELPFNNEPKIVLIDEAYMSMDSRDWGKNTSITKFFNTIGKQNILFIITAPFPDMIEMRVRKQQNYVIFSKYDEKFLHYKIVDMQRQKEKIFAIQKCPEIFNRVKYDTLECPDIVEMKFNKF